MQYSGAQATTPGSQRLKSVFRGVGEADCLRQADADVVQARSRGYEPESQDWSEENGLKVLTVTYVYTGRVAPTPVAPAPAVATPPARAALRASILVVGAGAGLIAVGAFLPWITATVALVGTVERNAFDGGGDGVITLAAAAVIALAALGLARRPSIVLKVLVIGAALVVGWVLAVDLPRIQDVINTVSTSNGIASVGAGVFATAIGAVISVLGALAA
jgi:hypothetical protein